MALTDETEEPNQMRRLEMITRVACSYFGNHQVMPDKVGDVLKTIAGGLDVLSIEGGGGTLKPARLTQAQIKKSVTPDALICFEDGKPYKTMKRRLRGAFNLSPEEYRTKWGLPADYPMVAPNYAKLRSAFAKKIGLGRVPQKPKPKK